MWGPAQNAAMKRLASYASEAEGFEILDAMFDSPDPWWDRNAYPVPTMEKQSSKLRDEARDRRRAVQNLAGPVLTRQAATHAASALALDEFYKRKEAEDASEA